MLLKKLSIMVMVILLLLLSACTPADVSPETPQDEEKDNINDVITPDEPTPPVEPDIPAPVEPDTSEPVEPDPPTEPDMSEPIEPDVSEHIDSVEPDIQEPVEPTIDYQEIIDNYLAEEIVYYEVRNNLLYRQETEKTRPYPLDSEFEEIKRITDEIIEKTSKAIGCDTSDENFKYLFVDYKVSYAIYNDKLYRYFYEEDYLEVIYENEELCYAQFYTNRCATISLYSNKWYDYIERITSLGYKTVDEANDDDVYFYGNHVDDIITIDFTTGEETLLEGRTNVFGDPYSEIDGDFPGVITIE